MKAKVEYAPDGQHYQTIKTAQTVTRLWDFFCFSRDIRQQISCNPFAKFRLISENNSIVGYLPR